MATDAVPTPEPKLEPTPPSFSFTTHPSTAPYAVSLADYLAAHPAATFTFVATSALVFNRTDPTIPRILLLQRAAHDSFPNRWEPPGGGCDPADASILHGAARELWEEAGLRATAVGPLVGAPEEFRSRSGKAVRQVSFLVRVVKGEAVRLDATEHQRWLWASEAEVRAGRVGEVEVEFTTPRMEAVVLEAFRVLEANG